MKFEYSTDLLVFCVIAIVNAHICNAGLSDGLVLWLPFNNTFSDFSGNLNHATKATIVTGLPYDPIALPTFSSDQCGSANSAACFNGSAGLVIQRDETHISSVEYSGVFSFSLWAYFDPNSPATSFSISDSGAYNWMLWASSFENRVYFQYYPSGSYIYCDCTIIKDTWYHLAVTGDGKNYTIFANGNKLCTEEFSNMAIGTTGDIYIGMSTSSQVQFLVGKLSDVRIYNRVLSTIEMQQLATVCSTVPVESSSTTQVESSSTNNVFELSSSKLNTRNQYYAVVIIVFESTTTTDLRGILVEIVDILGIDSTLIQVLSLSSTQIEVKISGESISEVQIHANQLINQINNGQVTGELLRKAIIAYLRGNEPSNDKQFSATIQNHFSTLLIFVVLFTLF